MLSLEHSSPELEALIAELRDAQRAARRPGARRSPPRASASTRRPTSASTSTTLRDVGDYNPCVPRYELELRGRATGAHGTVEFPISYEGPPGIVHGGFLAVFFDCVLQQLNCDLGLAGKTAELSLRYRRPTPLLTPLVFRAERVVDDRRITAHAELLLGDDLLCEAQMLTAAKGDHGALPAVSPRRP